MSVRPDQPRPDTVDYHLAADIHETTVDRLATVFAGQGWKLYVKGDELKLGLGVGSIAIYPHRPGAHAVNFLASGRFRCDVGTLREVIDRIAALLEAHRIVYNIEVGDHAGNDVHVVRHPDW
jgi:hypothetical protein